MFKLKNLFLLFVICAFVGLVSTGAQEKGDKLKPTETQKLDAWLQLMMHVHSKKADITGFQKAFSIGTMGNEPSIGVLIKAKCQKRFLDGPGVITYTQIGDIITASVTFSGLERLARNPDVVKIEPSHRVYPSNDVATASSIDVCGEIKEPGEVDTYTLQVKTAGQKITIRMHAPPSDYNTGKLDPSLILTDSSRINVLASNNDSDFGKDAEITYTFSNAGTYYITCSDATGAGTGFYKLVLISSEEIPLDSISGGDINQEEGNLHMLGINAKPLHEMGYEGSGIIIGVIDTGIDWTHEDFKDANGNSRILYLWDQSLTPTGDETSPDVGNDGNPNNDYGVEYTQAQINSALAGLSTIRSNDTEGHGTHVAGIAGGDGSATNGQEPAGRYMGVAPKADLIIVKKNGTALGIFDAINYIFSKAKIFGKPCVINISLGCNIGPADGTSLADQGVTNAVGPGRAIVVAAGNEGDKQIRARGTIQINPSDSVKFTIKTTGLIDIWYDKGDQYTITLTAPNGESFSVYAGSINTGTIDGTIADISNSELQNKNNGDGHAVVDIKGTGSPPYTWTITLTRTANGGNGRFDMYIPSLEMASFKDENGNLDSHVPLDLWGFISGTIGDPATSDGAITVGAHTTKFRWLSKVYPYYDDYFKSYESFGDIAGFSSRGPTRDGRNKPDIIAPGLRVTSSYSYYAQPGKSDVDDEEDISKDDKHVQMQGTSQAAPMVTGAIALLFQIDKNIYPRPLLMNTAKYDKWSEEILEYLKTAYPDYYKTIKNTYGAGKINLIKGKEMLSKDNPPSVNLTVSPSNSGQAPFTVTFTANASDPDKDDKITEFLWDCDGDEKIDKITYEGGNTYQAMYREPGNYTAKITVVDKYGKVASSTLGINVTGYQPTKNPPNTPGNISPADGATDVSLTPTLQSLAFSDPDSGDTQSGSQWQISTDHTFAFVLYDSGKTTNLTQFTVPSGWLNYSIKYYWRVRYGDNTDLWSDWSPPTSFTTLAGTNNPPADPTNISPADGATGVSITPVLTASPYSDPDGDKHLMTEWVISKTSSLSNIVWWVKSYSNLTSITVPEGILNYSTIYYWLVIYRDTGMKWGNSMFTVFATESAPVINNSPHKPNNTSPQDKATITITTPLLKASSFTDPDGDAHSDSEWQISTDKYFLQVIWGERKGSITEVSVPEGKLQAGKTYYWRVRYKDSKGNWSSWSEGTSFNIAGEQPSQQPPQPPSEEVLPETKVRGGCGSVGLDILAFYGIFLILKNLARRRSCR